MLDTTRGADQTVGEIRRKIIGGATCPPVQAIRDSLVRNLPAGDKKAEARAIFDFVDRAIRYTDNPPNFDSVKSAGWVVEEYLEGRRTPANCTTQTVLVGALARSLNIPVRLKVIGDTSPTRRLWHIYPELKLNGKWTAADVTAATSGKEYFMQRAGLGFSAAADLVKTYPIRGLGMLVREKGLGQFPGRRKMRGRRRLGQVLSKEEAMAADVAGAAVGLPGAGSAINKIDGVIKGSTSTRGKRLGPFRQLEALEAAAKTFRDETTPFAGKSLPAAVYGAFVKQGLTIWENYYDPQLAYIEAIQ